MLNPDSPSAREIIDWNSGTPMCHTHVPVDLLFNVDMLSDIRHRLTASIGAWHVLS